MTAPDGAGERAEAGALRDAFSSFFSREATSDVVRRAEPLGFDAGLWTRLCETGAPGMGAPVAAGGGGAALVDLVVVAEEAGRTLAPVPLVDHAVAAIVHPDIAIVQGTVRAVFAPRPAGDDGVWALVPAGAVAEVVVGLDGGELVAVHGEPPGVAPRNHACMPMASRDARRGERQVLGTETEFHQALANWKVLTAASLVGLSEAALALGVDYVTHRQQFGVPVGSFQAVQHGLADLPGLIDGARLLVEKAAEAGDADGSAVIDLDDNRVEDPRALAAMAFVFASDTAARVTDRSLHYHGGYGFSAEYDIQLYYRRARGWPLAYSGSTRECLAIADQLFPAEGGD